MKIRLDDMTIEDVRKLYEPMFEHLIVKDELDKVYQKYLKKYNEMKVAEKNDYKPPSGIGREYKYLKNILYGWYIEDLFYILLSMNKNILNVDMTGNDSEHNLIYNHDNKSIKIGGEKTTNPDYLITLQNGKKIFLELKTAAAEVYTIKAGNVKQLQKTMGFTSIYSMIIMVDLVHGLYEIKGLDFFINSFPFVNNRMEGQLCYNFPNPSKKFDILVNEKFDDYIKESLFEIEEVKKYKCLFLAQEKGDTNIIRNIKNKISIDELKSEFKFTEDRFNRKIEKIIGKSKDIEFKSWQEILSSLEEKL